jgi:hypothetical protein
MEISDSNEIDLVALVTEVEPEGMSELIEILLPEFSEAIDPTFLDPDVEYMGRIDGFRHENVGPQQTGYLDMCLSDLEMFAVSSARADGMVLLRKGDEMIIMTEYNAEVIQEKHMSEIMRAVQEQVAELIKRRDTSSDSGMFR